MQEEFKEALKTMEEELAETYSRELDALFCQIVSCFAGGPWRWKSDSWISGARLVTHILTT